MMAAATVAQLLREGTDKLAQAGVGSPEFDARSLMACVLDVELGQIPVLPDQPLTAEQQQRFQEYLQHRCRREPLQYITGETEFFGWVFKCDRRAMVPRPETELLVEAVAAHCRQHLSEPVIADLGTGCGVIAISLALLLPAARIYATDISAEALQLAAENAGLHRLSDKIHFLSGPYLDPLEEAGILQQVEAVVTNPPYVSTDEIEGLQPEVRDFEPRPALDAGPQGLEFYARFLPQCRRLPRLRLLATEIGVGQAPAVTSLIYDHLAASQIEVLPDLAGIPRVVLAYLE